MHGLENRKIVILFIFSLLCFIFLIRLFYLQVPDNQYKLEASNNVLRRVIIYPARGMIYDRNGQLMVYNEAAYDLMVIPNQLQPIDTLAFCKLIGISKEQFIERIHKAKKYSRYKSLVFEKEISSKSYAEIQEKLMYYPGFYVQWRTLRKYPKSIAAHLLGYTGEVDENTIKKNPKYRMGDYIGMSGIEKSYEEILGGIRGINYLMVDVHNREKGKYLNGKFDTLAVSGKSMHITIDEKIQEYGEKLMQNKKGSIVAIEPSTGEILAFITSPTYDPNLLVGRARSKNFPELAKDSLKPLFNRALMAQYPPGSIFKLVDALIGQQEQVLFPETRYPCRGGYPLLGGKPKCHPHASPSDLRGSIRTSCNSYYSYVFRSIVDKKGFKTFEEGYTNWRNHILSFGIGRKLGTDLPHELSGNVPSVEYYNKYFGKNGWKSSTIVSLGIGQAELGILPVQMANVMCIIANRGYYYIPHIIKKLNDTPYTKAEFLKKNHASVDEKYYDVVIDGMEMAVQMGTAAASKIKDISMCGKTGTAQNPHGKDHSVFVAFAPRENPKIAIAVVVENAGFGGTWAAPIASLIIEKYLTDTITRPHIEERMLNANLIQNP